MSETKIVSTSLQWLWIYPFVVVVFYFTYMINNTSASNRFKNTLYTLLQR